MSLLTANRLLLVFLSRCALELDKTSIFIYLVVNIVHTDSTSDIILVAARPQRIFGIPCPRKGLSFDFSRVLESPWVPAESSGDKPAWMVRLLTFDTKSWSVIMQTIIKAVLGSV